MQEYKIISYFGIISNLTSPESSSIFLITEIFMSFCHHNSLCAISISDEFSLDCGVFVLALASSDVPGISDHKLEVVIIIN